MPAIFEHLESCFCFYSEQHQERLENLKELLKEESGNDWILESRLDTIALGVIDHRRFVCLKSPIIPILNE